MIKWIFSLVDFFQWLNSTQFERAAGNSATKPHRNPWEAGRESEREKLSFKLCVQYWYALITNEFSCGLCCGLFFHSPNTQIPIEFNGSFHLPHPLAIYCHFVRVLFVLLRRCCLSNWWMSVIDVIGSNGKKYAEENWFYAFAVHNTCECRNSYEIYNGLSAWYRLNCVGKWQWESEANSMCYFFVCRQMHGMTMNTRLTHINTSNIIFRLVHTGRGWFWDVIISALTTVGHSSNLFSFSFSLPASRKGKNAQTFTSSYPFHFVSFCTIHSFSRR